jgi:hypothetical protein
MGMRRIACLALLLAGLGGCGGEEQPLNEETATTAATEFWASVGEGDAEGACEIAAAIYADDCPLDAGEWGSLGPEVVGTEAVTASETDAIVHICLFFATDPVEGGEVFPTELVAEGGEWRVSGWSVGAASADPCSA